MSTSLQSQNSTPVTAAGQRHDRHMSTELPDAAVEARSDQISWSRNAADDTNPANPPVSLAYEQHHDDSAPETHRGISSPHADITLEDEVLPDYEPSHVLPTYDRINERGSISSVKPILTYHLRQQSRTVQILVPFGPSPHHSYRILSRSGIKLFGKKRHEFTLTRVTTGRANSLGSTSSASIYSHRGSSSSNLTRGREQEEEETAWMDFVNDGKLPWMPKATLAVKRQPRSPSEPLQQPVQRQSYHMTAQNFKDWKIHVPNSEQTFTWYLITRPTALELHPTCSIVTLPPTPIARFLHSRIGSRASGGAEVGVLEVFEINNQLGKLDIETIVGSCTIVMANFKRMGRHLWRYGTESEPETRETAIMRNLSPTDSISHSSGTTRSFVI